MSRSGRLNVLILHNTDYVNLSPEAPGLLANLDVEHAARDISEALRQRDHHASLFGLDLPGVPRLLDLLAGDPPDVVFNLCESLGTDARNEILVPALLDLVGVPYTGSGPTALSLSLHKDRAKALLRDRGVPTPESVVMRTRDAECPLPFPLIVKPIREDASIGISSASVVHHEAALRVAVGEIIDSLYQPAIVERYVEGRELYVSLLGNTPPVALPMHEIDFTELPAGLPRIVSYAGKWDTESAEFHGTRPVRCILDEHVHRRVRETAETAFAALDLADYGRIDVRLDEAGTPFVIDVNPNCDLGNGAGFSRAAKLGGLDYPAMIERICTIALERTRSRHRSPRQRHHHVDRPGASARLGGRWNEHPEHLEGGAPPLAKVNEECVSTTR